MHWSGQWSRWFGAAGFLLLIVRPAPLRAQVVDGQNEIFAGSEGETYLRVLQDVGLARSYPWSLRAFSPADVDRILSPDVRHPWDVRYPWRPDTAGGLRVRAIAPRSELIFNSAFPYGSNDGPIWAGRGITTAIQAGVSARYGPVSLELAPLFFRAENTPFPLEHGLNRDGYSHYADAADPGSIDLPQRFGNRPYQRVDPGQSTLRVELPALAAGISTANQYWGPASDLPMILGNNAAGFAHLFVGTSGPQSIGIGKVHAQVLWGRLGQSNYSPVPDSVGARFMTGVVAVFQPRGVPGLEVGGARFFHTAWPRGGVRGDDFLEPFQSLLKVGLKVQNPAPEDSVNDEVAKSSPDNQLASVFARWVFPKSGFEVYGEFGKEDHNYDVRDLLLELTHNAGYMVGARKSWVRPADRIVSLRFETLNTLPGISGLARTIPQTQFYRHAGTRQGHTQLGQVLGAKSGYGGGGSVLALDLYHPGGRWTLTWGRDVVRERGLRWGAQQSYGEKGIDVRQSLGAEALLFLGRLDVTTGLTGVYELNRYFADDAFNLNATLVVRARF